MFHEASGNENSYVREKPATWDFREFLRRLDTRSQGKPLAVLWHTVKSLNHNLYLEGGSNVYQT